MLHCVHDSLACPEQVEALIDYVVTEPPEDSEGKVKFIYPYKSSEVLTSQRPSRGTALAHQTADACAVKLTRAHGMQVLAADVAAVYDCMFANEHLLDKLFAFLEREAPLNTLLAGYFGKVVSTMLSRRPVETLQVMEKRNVVPQLLSHLGAYSILELLLKVRIDARATGRLRVLRVCGD